MVYLDFSLDSSLPFTAHLQQQHDDGEDSHDSVHTSVLLFRLCSVLLFRLCSVRVLEQWVCFSYSPQVRAIVLILDYVIKENTCNQSS